MSLDQPLLELHSIVHRYPGSLAAARVSKGLRERSLDEVSLAVRPGRRLALLGGNGAGKSTLLLMLNGSLRPDAGEVRHGGMVVDGSRGDLAELRGTVGVVFQDPDDQLFAGTVAQDVSFGPLNQKLSPEVVERRVADAIAAMGLEAHAELPPHMLSHGLRKRAAIAGVLAMVPRVLVLDEPTAGLDPAGESALLRELDAFLTPERAIVFSTHDVGLARTWADDVVILNDGRVAAAGDARTILADRDLLGSCGLLGEARVRRNSSPIAMGGRVASRLLVLTGDGKGKTSSASGMLLRAVGHGHRAVLVRFLKARPSGEVAVLGNLGVSVAGGGRGFLPPDPASSAFERHAQAAREAWRETERILDEVEEPALVVLDEICYAIHRGALEPEVVRARLERRRPGVSVVCTGRGAPEWLRDIADTVSSVECGKHAYASGVPATKGVEI